MDSASNSKWNVITLSNQGCEKPIGDQTRILRNEPNYTTWRRDSIKKVRHNHEHGTNHRRLFSSIFFKLYCLKSFNVKKTTSPKKIFNRRNSLQGVSVPFSDIVQKWLCLEDGRHAVSPVAACGSGCSGGSSGGRLGGGAGQSYQIRHSWRAERPPWNVLRRPPLRPSASRLPLDGDRLLRASNLPTRAQRHPPGAPDRVSPACPSPHPWLLQRASGGASLPWLLPLPRLPHWSTCPTTITKEELVNGERFKPEEESRSTNISCLRLYFFYIAFIIIFAIKFLRYAKNRIGRKFVLSNYTLRKT